MKCFSFLRVVMASSLAIALSSGSAAADVAYTDAVVTGMAGTVNTTGPTGAADSATAWRIRGTNGGTDANSFSNEGSALQYNTNPIDASNPTLTTTIGGLDPSKSYEVIVFYWDDLANATSPELPAVSPWDIAAKLSTEGTYTQFDSTAGHVVTDDSGNIAGVGAAAAGYSVIPFSQILGLNVLGEATDDYTDAYDGNRAMFGGSLGLISGIASVSVDIQPGTNSTQRSWYDGIGVREIPEPASMTLLALGLTCICASRRRAKV